MNGSEFWPQSNGKVQTHGDIMDAFKVKQESVVSSYRNQTFSEESSSFSLPSWLKLAVLGTALIVIAARLKVL